MIQKNILVTGGAGFIGSNFVRFILKSDPEARIVNLDLLTYAGSLQNLIDLPDESRHEFVQGDIADTRLVEHVIRDHNIDTIVNFAAESHVDRSITGPGAFIQTNIVGTFTLLEAARLVWTESATRNGPPLSERRFLHVSTDEVYGTLGPVDPPFREENRYLPNSPYSASKASSDLLVRAYHETYGLPALITNCSNNYGPRQYPEKLIPLMILNALSGKPLPVYGDGLQIRDWLYVEDHCAAILKVLDYGTLGEIYNIGGYCEKTNLEIVQSISAILDDLRPRDDGRSYVNQITHVADRPGHDRRYAIDCGKINRHLDWHPRETFETGLRKTIEWYLGNESWVNALMSETYSEWIDINYASRQEILA